MKRILIALALLILYPALSHAWPAQVVAVYDGDTVTVKDEAGKRHRIRLWGIDAPEKDQAGGIASAEHCRAVALWQMVDVQTKARDRYARLLAILVRKSGGWSINGNMVRMGHAWAHGAKRWKGAEARARVQGRGLWKYEVAVPPWVWRHKDKEKGK